MARASFLDPPRNRTPQCIRRKGQLRIVTAPIGGRPLRRTSREQRTALHRRPVSTHGVEASRPLGGVHRRSSWTGGRLSRGARPTARSTDRRPRNTTASGRSGGRYTVISRPPSYSNTSETSSPRIGSAHAPAPGVLPRRLSNARTSALIVPARATWWGRLCRSVSPSLKAGPQARHFTADCHRRALRVSPPDLRRP